MTAGGQRESAEAAGRVAAHAPAARRDEILILLVATVLLVIGWRLFWFLTDDAYIAFRYVSNRMLGHGFVWNAPPFLPVEGYTSFAWILILEGIWRVFGVEPPRSANVVSLVLTFGSLALTRSLLRRPLDVFSPRERLAILAGLLGFLVTNRTFLTWASSGLETALFVFLLLLWVRALAFSRSCRRLWAASCAAAALALTRPDGLLFCAATLLAAVVEAASLGGGASVAAPGAGKLRGNAGRLRRLVPCTPLLLVGIHELWRRATYGAWLPNTYHAKYLSPWPEAGLRYAYCFVVENGLWVPLLFLAFAWRPERRVGAGRVAASPAESESPPPNSGSPAPATMPRREPSPRAAARIVTTALALHVAYYTLIIGGDHFEYRVYAHVLPLGCVALVWGLRSFALRARGAEEMPRAPRGRGAVVLIAALCLASWPIPWTHWALSRRGVEHGPSFAAAVPVAPAFPAVLRPLLRPFDRRQAWLIEHYICARQEDHAAFWRSQLRAYPSREEGAAISGEGYPVLVASAVGVVAWVLPHVNILDASGLNDFVVARMPPPPGRRRAMAHERMIANEYVSDFRPNVAFDGREARVSRRLRALTAEDIRRAEAKWRACVERRASE